jgi:hypothetical protein
MVMGSVAEEEAVENAVSNAGATARINLNGLVRPINFTNAGSVTRA